MQGQRIDVCLGVICPFVVRPTISTDRYATHCRHSRGGHLIEKADDGVSERYLL